jgi:hypothetical protein
MGGEASERTRDDTMNLSDLSQQEVAELLRATADAISAWSPPAPESPPLLREAKPGYILTWDGVEYALPCLAGLGHLVTLMERSPTAVHVADLVDPTGRARLSLGKVWEPDIDAQAAATTMKALEGASDSDQAKMKSYLRGRGRRSVAGAHAIRSSVYKALRKALRLINQWCPAAHRHIKANLTTGFYCQYARTL